MFFISVQSTWTVDTCSFTEFVLLLDESESISDENWKIVKTFSKKLVTAIGISEHGNRAGVASFAKAARIRINCNEYSTTESLVNAIDSLDRNGKFVKII